mmetsp:Transcript_59892/g.143076  ORF Transcript_59892/g.143076 Transcript_59892/m.143076 type:complete len:306 (-) Transcript_59892:21-938(-)
MGTVWDHRLDLQRLCGFCTEGVYQVHEGVGAAAGDERDAADGRGCSVPDVDACRRDSPGEEERENEEAPLAAAHADFGWHPGQDVAPASRSLRRVLVAFPQCPGLRGDLYFALPVCRWGAADRAPGELLSEHLENAIFVWGLLEVRLLLPHCLVHLHSDGREKQGGALLRALPLVTGHLDLYAPWGASAGVLCRVEPLGVGTCGADHHVPQHGLDLFVHLCLAALVLLQRPPEAPDDNAACVRGSCHVGWQRVGRCRVEVKLSAKRLRSRDVEFELPELRMQRAETWLVADLFLGAKCFCQQAIA